MTKQTIMEIYKIGALRAQAEKKYKKSLESINADERASSDYKKELAKSVQEDYKNRITQLNFEYKNSIMRLNDYTKLSINVDKVNNTISTLKLLGNSVKYSDIENAISKHKGNEQELRAIRQYFIDNHIGTARIDAHMFERFKDKGNDLDRGNNTEDYFSSLYGLALNSPVMFSFKMKECTDKFNLSDDKDIAASAALYNESTANTTDYKAYTNSRLL